MWHLPLQVNRIYALSLLELSTIPTFIQLDHNPEKCLGHTYEATMTTASYVCFYLLQNRKRYGFSLA